MRRSPQTVVVALFVALLVLPSLEQYGHVVPIAPVVESRPKVPLPSGNPIAGLWLANGWFSDYERHYNDVFGFRDLFIRLRNQIQFSLFRDSNQVVVGTGGWLADKSAVEVEQRAVDALGDAQWAALRERVVRLDAALRKRGIVLLVVPVPLKNTVYPERFPAISARRPAVTGYERFRRMLADAHVPFVDAYRVLEERRKTADVYYHTDLHWNTFGARAVAAATVDTLAQRFGDRVVWRYPDRYAMVPFRGGGENEVLATFVPVTDVEPDEEQAAPCGPVVKTESYERFANGCSGPKLPQAMLFGNSFSLQMIADGLPNHFTALYLVSDLNHFGDMLAMLQPGTKVVIWQLFELEIGYQLQSYDWWAQLDAER